MLTDCTTGPNGGGNNRARTYDLLLVRQMLSQLSYAPKDVAELFFSATWIIIHRNNYFVKHYFCIFEIIFPGQKTCFLPPDIGLIQIFFSRSRMSSGVNL